MRSKLHLAPITVLTVCSVFMSPLAWSEEETEVAVPQAPALRYQWLELSAGAFRPGIPGVLGLGPIIQGSFDAGIVLGSHEGHRPLTLGGVLSYSRLPTQGLRVDRRDLTFRVGYWFLENRLGILGSVGTTITGSDAFEEGAYGYHWGLEGKYRLPLSERWALTFGAGWTHYQQAELRHDTGIPVTSDSFANFACSFFTFGVASSCGTQRTTLTIPASNAAVVDVGLSIAL
jgi:hypothetical protein